MKIAGLICYETNQLNHGVQCQQRNFKNAKKRLICRFVYIFYNHCKAADAVGTLAELVASLCDFPGQISSIFSVANGRFHYLHYQNSLTVP